MKNVARASAQDRADLFRIAAEASGLTPALIEKDFWVCWTLQRLFALPVTAPHLLFKGGTTLSKVYKVIQRFSEDIDISVSREFIRPGEADAVENAPSRAQREKELKRLKDAFVQVIGEVIYPELRVAIAEELGQKGWHLVRDNYDPGTLLFTYPVSLSATLGRMASGDKAFGVEYILPTVRIEMGGRSDLWPSEDAVVTAYAAEAEPTAFEQPNIAVRILAVERTFWEKATLLHNEFYRPLVKGRGDRISRHYSDLTRLTLHPELGPRCLAARDIAARVVQHKNLYYRDNWSRYGEVLTGGLHLLPGPEVEGVLRADFAQMSSMFFGEPQSFDEVLATLAEMERTINWK